MLILSLDTTTRAGGCALLRDDRVLREHSGDGSRDQAERLPGDLTVLLEHEAVALDAIDAFAVATGPGSFTGLRVGIATMQGLAMATGKPLIGVSAFDALAMLASGDRIATWIDAWRGEVFAAVYENGQLIGAPVVAPPDLLLEQLQGRRTLHWRRRSGVRGAHTRDPRRGRALHDADRAPARRRGRDAGGTGLSPGRPAVAARHSSDLCAPV